VEHETGCNKSSAYPSTGRAEEHRMMFVFSEEAFYLKEVSMYREKGKNYDQICYRDRNGIKHRQSQSLCIP
jgi:hypothetical protein